VCSSNPILHNRKQNKQINKQTDRQTDKNKKSEFPVKKFPRPVEYHIASTNYAKLLYKRTTEQRNKPPTLPAARPGHLPAAAAAAASNHLWHPTVLYPPRSSLFSLLFFFSFSLSFHSAPPPPFSPPHLHGLQ